MKTRKQLQIEFSWKLKRFGTTLVQKLIGEGRTKWLDVGSGDKFDDGFEFFDWFPSSGLPPNLLPRYHQGNILELTSEKAEAIGAFDLVRMQHVLEHFSFEEAPAVLKSCALLLKPQGFLLVTVPDLRIFAKAFLRRKFDSGFTLFAQSRIPPNAPSSCYFSVYAHSFGYSPISSEHNKHRDQHKWCYDYEGVAYQLKRTGMFSGIQELTLFNPLSLIPFTHNRPEEDLCVLAQKID